MRYRLLRLLSTRHFYILPADTRLITRAYRTCCSPRYHVKVQGIRARTQVLVIPVSVPFTTRACNHRCKPRPRFKMLTGNTRVAQTPGTWTPTCTRRISASGRKLAWRSSPRSARLSRPRGACAHLCPPRANRSAIFPT
jgi:hypothetical protein